MKMATRIKVRAVRRVGELLGQIEPSPGVRTDLPRAPIGGLTRTEAAREAGLSPHQQFQAMRVAAIPEDEVEERIEGYMPPTITELTAPRPTRTTSWLWTNTRASMAQYELVPDKYPGGLDDEESAAIRDGMRRAMNERRRRDADRPIDPVLRRLAQFSAIYTDLIEAEDFEAMAAWNVVPWCALDLRQKTRAARDALDRFIAIMEAYDASQH